MLDVVFTIISGFVSGLFIIFWGYVIYDIKILKIKWYHIFVLILYSILFYYSTLHFSHLLYTGSFLFSFLVLHQIFFPISFSKICANSFIIILIRCLIMIICSLINFTIFCDHYWINSLLINTITTILILLFKALIKNKVKSYAIYNKKSWISIIIVSFIIVLIFVLEISIEKFGTGFLLLFPICCLLYLFFSVYRFTYQKITLDTYLANYYEIFKFSKFMEDIIDNYKTQLYDTRNELTIIKDKLKEIDKSLVPYLNLLIEEKSHIDYSWLVSLSYFNIPKIKGFLSYKIQEMKDLGLEIELFISDSLAQATIALTDYDIKNLYIIIGILCDNAKEAAIKSCDKTVTFQAYYDNDGIHLIIANTYDKVIPLINIDNFGVTGHKRGCGTGLYIVHSIIENNNIFRKKTSIIDNFFIQEITIDKNHQKSTI